MSEAKWYASGLRFGCLQCGRCCGGAPGYVWVTREEVRRIARYLQRDDDRLPADMLRRVGLRYSLAERSNGDCVFLVPGGDGKRHCHVYSVRPLQCRTWPFWNVNLHSPSDWAEAGERCPGINTGRCYDPADIEEIRRTRAWEET